MSAEDFYKEYYPSKMHLFRDKSDRQLQIFGIDDMINFADEYHKAKKLNKGGCPKCAYPEIVSSIDSFDSSCPNCGNEWKTK